jgi:hypothetical protein
VGRRLSSFALLEGAVRELCSQRRAACTGVGSSNTGATIISIGAAAMPLQLPWSSYGRHTSLSAWHISQSPLRG